MIADATQVSVFFGEGVMSDGVLASDALMDALARRLVPAATLLRGIEGFGLHRRIQAERLPEISTDRPLLAVAVAVAEQNDIASVLDEVDYAVPRGLVALETTCLATGADVACARPSPGPGDAVQIAISCGAAERAGREPVFRVAVEILRDAGAKCAVVLAGADGLVHGMRRRVDLWPVLDELTAEHGTVTCLPLPGYRERAANTVRGELRLGWS